MILNPPSEARTEDAAERKNEIISFINFANKIRSHNSL